MGLLFFSEYARKAEEATLKLTHETQKYTTEVQKNLHADTQRVARLKELAELSEKETLNNGEMEEANRLIKTLTEKYGDLGISIDATTGKIVGMTSATKKMSEAQKAVLQAALARKARSTSSAVN